MAWKGCAVAAAAFMSVALLGAETANLALAQSPQSNAAYKVGKHTLRCGRVRTVFDRNLPMEGAAVIGEALYLNPVMLKKHSETVRLFVFHHECGHHRLNGGTELKADCHAAEQGVRDGWLDRSGVDEVCRSLGNEPASYTHPSGAKRCKNIQKCFASALASSPRGAPEVTAAKPAEPPPLPTKAFRLVRGPSLVAEGISRQAPPPLPCPSPRRVYARAEAGPDVALGNRRATGCD